MLPKRTLYLVAMLAVSSTALAQEDLVTNEIEAAKEHVSTEEKAEEVPEGWDTSAAMGANFSYTQSQSWVGNPDGATMQIGVLMNGSANFRKGSHRWLNEGKVVHTQTRTPTIPVFVKSADEVNLKTTYFYAPRKIDWVGPFARGTLNTALLPGYYVGADPALVTEPAGDTFDTVEIYHPTVEGEPYKLGLTSSFEPLILKEVAGLMANPVDGGNKLHVAMHIGAGAEEVFTHGGFVVKEVTDTAGDVTEGEETFAYTKTVVIIPLESYVSVGAALEVEANRAVNDYVNWTLSATFFQPVYTTAEAANASGSLLNTDVSAKVSVKLARWASLDLVAAARKFPLILDEWQFQSGVLLTTTFNLI